MSALIRSFDWARTPLGSPEKWSQSLRTMVDLLLSNRFPLLCGGGQITPPSSPMPTDPFSEGNTPNLSGPYPGRALPPLGS